jgi:hypothetical protein
LRLIFLIYSEYVRQGGFGGWGKTGQIRVAKRVNVTHALTVVKTTHSIYGENSRLALVILKKSEKVVFGNFLW